MYEELIFVVRILCFFAIAGLLVLLQRSLHLKAAKWTPYMLDLFRWLQMILILLLVGAAVQIGIHGIPNPVPVAELGVLGFGYYVLLKPRKESGYERASVD